MFAVRLLVLVSLGLGALVAPALAQEPFYKGKRLTVIINFAAGSATDIEAAYSRGISPASTGSRR